MPTQGETFTTGEEVVARGVYVCAPCGYKKKLDEGDTFPECDSCERDKAAEAEADPDDVPEPSGIWEYVGTEDTHEGVEEIAEEEDNEDDE